MTLFPAYLPEGKINLIPPNNLDLQIVSRMKEILDKLYAVMQRFFVIQKGHGLSTES